MGGQLWCNGGVWNMRVNFVGAGGAMHVVALTCSGTHPTGVVSFIEICGGNTTTVSFTII
jgi:hypothetical protein